MYIYIYICTHPDEVLSVAVLLFSSLCSLPEPPASSCVILWRARGQRSGVRGQRSGVISTNIYTCVFLYGFRRVPSCVLLLLNHRCQRRLIQRPSLPWPLLLLLLFWLWLWCYYGLSVCVCVCAACNSGGDPGNRWSIIDDWMKRRKWDSESGGEAGERRPRSRRLYLLYVYVYFILYVYFVLEVYFILYVYFILEVYFILYVYFIL